MTREELLQWLRTEFPVMLQGDPMFRAQVIGVLSEVLVTKAEFAQLLEELRALRAESELRLEALRTETQQRFQILSEELRALRAETQQQFKEVRAEVAKVALSVGALGGRMGRRLEDVVRQVIENFSGIGPLKAERLVLIDETGEFRHPGATVEFDAVVTNGRKFLVEVKSYADADDVWTFAGKAQFAETKLGESFEKVLICPAASRSAQELAQTLGITC